MAVSGNLIKTILIMNLLIVKRAGRDLIRHKDDGYDSSLNKLPSFLNIKFKLGQISRILIT